MNEDRARKPDAGDGFSEAVPTHPDIIERLEELGLIDDPEFTADALNTFIQDGSGTVERMAVAISNGDAQTCEGFAHRIKGAALNVGATRLGEIARLLEEMGHGGEISGAGPHFEELRIEFARVRLFATEYIEKIKAA